MSDEQTPQAAAAASAHASPGASIPKVWRRRDCREPLLVSARALDLEYSAGPREREMQQGVYVLDVCGPLEHHHSDHFDSFHDIARCVGEALDNPDVRAIVLRIDSPGGVANGMASTSRAIRRKADRLGKPIFAYADEQICSAAYGLACAADEIWGPPTAEIGSVGVILPVVDQTEANAAAGIRVELLVTGARKGDGHPDKPLDDAAIDALQARVDAIGADFFDLVAEARGMSPEDVAALQAGVFMGAEAVDRGLADGVADWQTFFDLIVSTLDKRAEISPTKSVSNGTAKARGKAVDMAREKRLALAKAKQEAEQAVAAAAAIVDPTARAEAMQKAVAASFEAASKFYKKTIKIEESTEDDEPKDDAEDQEEKKSNGRYVEESEDDEDKKDAEEDDDGDDDEDMDAEDGEEDDAEDEKSEDDDGEEDEKKSKRAEDRKDPYKTRKASIVGVARALTGGKSKAEVLGRLDAMAEKAKRYDAVAADVERMRKSERTAKVEKLIKSAIDAKKLGPKDAKMSAQLRDMGMSSPKRLAAFVDAMPRIVPRTVEEGGSAPAVDGEGSPARTDVLSSQMRAVIESTARITGKTIEQVTAEYMAAYNRAAGR